MLFPLARTFPALLLLMIYFVWFEYEIELVKRMEKA